VREGDLVVRGVQTELRSGSTAKRTTLKGGKRKNTEDSLAPPVAAVADGPPPEPVAATALVPSVPNAAPTAEDGIGTDANKKARAENSSNKSP